MTGRELNRWTVTSDRYQVVLDGLESGLYMLRIGESNHKVVVR